jgi:hypothetical protein
MTVNFYNKELFKLTIDKEEMRLIHNFKFRN